MNKHAFSATFAATLGAALALATAPVSARSKPGPDPPSPTYPPARSWHAFASNSGDTAATSRLYLFGGYDASFKYLNDLWIYAGAGGSRPTWTPAPIGTSKPGPRGNLGWSCSNDQCIAVGGTNGGSSLKETWIYAAGSWSQVNCRRFTCPPARVLPALAYDPILGVHVLFGGEANNDGLDDTYTFAAGKWTRQTPAVTPGARSGAAAAYVPGRGVVLLGGMKAYAAVLCDMHVWTGTTWESIDTGSTGVCLRNHSMAWDGSRLVVVGGYDTMTEKANTKTWYFQFDAAMSKGTWKELSATCWASAVDPTTVDSVVHPGAMMAFDRPSGLQVFFGGEENVAGLGAVRYGNTVECQ